MRIITHLDDTLQFMVKEGNTDLWLPLSDVSSTDAFSTYLRSLDTAKREKIQQAMITEQLKAASVYYSEDSEEPEAYHFSTEDLPSSTRNFHVPQISDSDSSLEAFLRDVPAEPVLSPVLDPITSADIDKPLILNYSSSNELLSSPVASSTVSKRTVTTTQKKSATKNSSGEPGLVLFDIDSTETSTIVSSQTSRSGERIKDVSMGISSSDSDSDQELFSFLRSEPQVDTPIIKDIENESQSSEGTTEARVTPQRGTGRPRKPPTTREVPVPAKRGRGRPPKNSTASTHSVETPKRGRGRPKNSLGPKKVYNLAKSKPEAPKKGRGRPKKVLEPVDESSDNEQMVEASDSRSDESDMIQPPKRGRGRPKKAVTPKQSTKKTPMSTSNDESSSSEPEPPKRGPGRPRKTPVSTNNGKSSSSGPEPPKRGRGRPRKTPVSTNNDEASSSEPEPPKRGRGRPRKTPVSTNNDEASSSEPEPPKRGRGRPRKTPVLTEEKSSSSEPELPKRGRGRPRKTMQYTDESSSEPESPKRGPGKPKKTLSDFESSSNEPEPPKRGRGRPRKTKGESSHVAPKRGRGRPRKTPVSTINDESSSSEAEPPKRGRGRPRKASRADSPVPEIVTVKRSTESTSKKLRAAANLCDVSVEVESDTLLSISDGEDLMDFSISPSLVKPSKAKGISPVVIYGGILGKREDVPAKRRPGRPPKRGRYKNNITPCIVDVKDLHASEMENLPKVQVLVELL